MLNHDLDPSADIDLMIYCVLARLRPRFPSLGQAFTWYAEASLPGFSGKTARELVHAGRGADVLEYIDAVDAGIHT